MWRWGRSPGFDVPGDGGWSDWRAELLMWTFTMPASNRAVLIGLFWLHFLTGSAAKASGSEFCAFEVQVRDHKGSPKPGVAVLLVQAGKGFAEEKTDRNGVARICNAPVDFVDIVVGNDLCGASWVRHIKQRWPETAVVSVTHQELPCDHFAVEDGCILLLRVRDQDGRPVKGARVEWSAKQDAGVTDLYGRVFLKTRRREDVKGTITKDGRRGSFSDQCVDDHERIIVLR